MTREDLAYSLMKGKKQKVETHNEVETHNGWATKVPLGHGFYLQLIGTSMAELFAGTEPHSPIYCIRHAEECRLQNVEMRAPFGSDPHWLLVGVSGNTP